MRQPVLLDGESLTLTEVERVARHDEPVQIAERAKGKMQESRAIVERIAADRAQRVYGVNTGFGSLKDVAIANADLARLQHNLLMSHSAGVGDPLPTDTVRTAMVLRANALAKGFSGVRLEVVQT
ncbi:MAG TPA: aromatic amino acid lyase, partial [bacterium]|nr:aromatic amino acid lyase [bacterium]